MAHILVVDDEPSLLSLMSTMLDCEGHMVETRTSAESALQFLEAAVPDLIVCDIRMEGMTGYDFLELVRKARSTAFVPFIFMTGQSDRQAMRSGMQLGADDFLPKPFNRSELLSAIDTRLKLRAGLEAEHKQHLEQLRESVCVGLPHELRTPLTSVIAFAKIIEDDVASLSQDDIVAFARMIHAGGMRLHRLAENYITYSQLALYERDPSVVEAVRTENLQNADETIRRAAVECAMEHGRRENLEVRLDTCPLAISAEYLKVLVRELVDNAFKFSEAGARVRIAGIRGDNMYELQIIDRGRGMTDGQLQNIGAFVQFERKTIEQQGSGLGLAVANRIMRLFGGSINIESKVGTGTTIRMFIPSVALAPVASQGVRDE